VAYLSTSLMVFLLAGTAALAFAAFDSPDLAAPVGGPAAGWALFSVAAFAALAGATLAPRRSRDP
jgi:hypothetical protein